MREQGSKASSQLFALATGYRLSRATIYAAAWHAAGLAHGGTTCEEPPGERIKAMVGRVYIAYLRDPDGNKLGAFFHPDKAP